MKKYAIIVGHTNSSPGAHSPHGIEPEFFFNSEVTKHLADVADIYYYDTYKYGYISMVRRLYRHINQHDYDLTIELHYNAASPSANGTEVLYYKTNKKGKELASKLSKMISERFDTFNRGVKGRSRKDRGGYALYAGKTTSLLVEPFFGSNKEDTEKFKGKEKEYAKVIKDFIKTLQ